MKKELIIGTFNLKNDLWNKNWKYKEYAKQVANYIKNKKIDILATQELTKKYSKELYNNLSNYNIYGKYRYKKIFFLSKYDERVGIITNKIPIKIYNKYLSLFPSIPRVLTAIEQDNLFIINIHLDYKSMKAKEKEIKKLYKFILNNKDKNIILLGDFNLKEENNLFKEFKDKLKELKINQITNKKVFVNKPIDHIFISNNIELLDIWTDKELISISDHRPIFIKIKLKK